jgi:hypothetical protein
MTELEKEMAREKEVSTDMWAVVSLLTSPDWHNLERRNDLSIALAVYSDKYGRDILRDLEETINEAVYQACELIHEGEEA